MSTKAEVSEERATAPSASTAQSQPQQPPARRRTRQRHAGPPQLQFLTATNPSQFKDEKAKRSVRSQAMMQYRYQTSEQKRKSKDITATTPGPRSAQTEKQEKPSVRPRRRIASILLNDGYANKKSSDAFVSQWLEEPHETIYNSTSEAWWNKNANAPHLAEQRRSVSQWHGAFAAAEPSATSYAASTSSALVPSSRYLQALAAMPKDRRSGRVINYEDTEAHDGELLQIIAATVTSSKRMGNGMDPFVMIPQFRNPELNAVFLVRRCNRAFSSKYTLERWLPVMLSDPHILLSSTIMATTWLDMHAGICAESKRTVLLKQEAIGYINERLRDSRALEDSTLAIIIHVLAGEMWSCNEDTLRIHQKGVARLITHRGGMSQLGGSGMVAQVAAAVTYHGNLICEDAPLPLFYEWKPPPYSVDETLAVPESPLFCPRSHFITVVRDRGCSVTTHDLLCDMLDLTDLFISHHTTVDAVLDLEVAPDSGPCGHASAELNGKFAEIRAKVASLPSAHIPGLPTTHDWVYEACRISAIIYTSAIIMHVPLSAAAEPRRNIIMQDIVALTGSYESTLPFVPRLTETLYEVIEKTNIGDLWNNMSGVFYWVTTVGAAAARTPVTVDLYRRPTCANDAYATWVRRCLIMFATRTLILMLFEHPLPLLMAEKRLLRVQEILGSVKGQAPVDWHKHAQS